MQAVLRDVIFAFSLSLKRTLSFPGGKLNIYEHITNYNRIREKTLHDLVLDYCLEYEQNSNIRVIGTSKKQRCNAIITGNMDTRTIPLLSMAK